MKQDNITPEDIQKAVIVQKDLAIHLEKPERDRLKTLLTKRLTLAETLTVVETILHPALNKVYKQYNESLVMQLVLKKLGMTDQQWEDAVKEVEDANKKAEENLKKQIAEKSK